MFLCVENGSGKRHWNNVSCNQQVWWSLYRSVFWMKANAISGTRRSHRIHNYLSCVQFIQLNTLTKKVTDENYKKGEKQITRSKNQYNFVQKWKRLLWTLMAFHFSRVCYLRLGSCRFTPTWTILSNTKFCNTSMTAAA